MIKLPIILAFADVLFFLNVKRHKIHKGKKGKTQCTKDKKGNFTVFGGKNILLGKKEGGIYIPLPPLDGAQGFILIEFVIHASRGNKNLCCKVFFFS